MDNQELNKESKRKAHFIISISLLSFIFFAAIDLAVRAAWEAPTLDAPAGNKSGFVVNQTTLDKDVYALIDRNLSVTGNLSIGQSSPGFVGNIGFSEGTSPVSVRQEFGTDNTGWQYRIAKNVAGVVTDLVTIQDNGNVGIGTTNPTANLDVSGDVYLGSNLSLGGDLIVKHSRINRLISDGYVTSEPTDYGTRCPCDNSPTWQNCAPNSITALQASERCYDIATGHVPDRYYRFTSVFSYNSGQIDLGVPGLGAYSGSLYMNNVQHGFMRPDNTWMWRFVNGVLDTGTVPASQVTGDLPYSRISDGPECVTKTATMNSWDWNGDGTNYGSVQCDDGWTMTGGGCHVKQHCWSKLLRHSRPESNGWYCGQTPDCCSGNCHGGTVYVRCCSL